ncbi:MAG: hypothetical protein IJ501_02265 [Bacilli bacterium]|nr:hypothetical protein [Bacilli bacterium]
MKEIALEFLKIITDNGYKAYIVGGFVRDFLMNLESKDIDITTNATPKEIKNIFKKVEFSKQINDEESYGSTRVNYKNILFEVTTFRKELEYFDNRHPSSIIYVDDLETDLKRRDFTINAICMDKEGNIIDPLNGRRDLEEKLIKTINESQKSFSDDALRILRAIRFSTTLQFKLDEDIIKSIKNTKDYLKNISYERKKIELDKIFASRNAKYGINLIKELDLVNSLELENIDRIKDYSDLNSIWSMINSSVYRFTKPEKELIKKVNVVYSLDNLNPLVLYKYGLYVNLLSGLNKGINKKQITKCYNELPIKSKSDIQIAANDICKILKQKPGSFLNHIYNTLEIEILTGNLENNLDEIKKYIQKNFNKVNI